MPFTEDIERAIAARAEGCFSFLERLVAEPSTVGREAGVLEVFATELAAMGFDVERLPIPAATAELKTAGVPPDRDGGHVTVGRREHQRAGRSLLLNGHLDVVPAESEHLWRTPPFVPHRREGRMYGRGTGDMKCGIAMGALAISALDEVAPDAISGPLTFLGVVEEEITGNGTLAAAAAGVLADAVVVLEATDLGLLLGGVGVLWLEVTVTGRAGHAHEAQGRGGVVDTAMALVAGLRAWALQLGAGDPDPLFDALESPYAVNLGTLTTGDWTSSVPSSATVGVRVGYPRGWSARRAESVVREVVEEARAAAAAEHHVHVRSSGLRAEGYLLDEDDPLVTALSRAHEDAHGRPAERFVLGSTTDARTYVNDFATPALCFGPSAADIHGVDESVDLRSVLDGAATLAHFLRAHYAGGAERG